MAVGFIRNGKLMTTSVVVERWKNMAVGSQIMNTIDNANAAATPDLGRILTLSFHSLNAQASELTA